MQFPFTFLLSGKADVKRNNFYCDLFIAWISRYTAKSPLSISLKAEKPFVVFFYVLKGSIKSFIPIKEFKEIVTIREGQYRAISVSPGKHRLNIVTGKNVFFYFILKNSLFHKISTQYRQLQALTKHILGKNTSNIILPLQPINDQITSHILKIAKSRKNDVHESINTLKIFIDLVTTYAIQIENKQPELIINQHRARHEPEMIVHAIRNYILNEIRLGRKPILSEQIKKYPITSRTFFNYFKEKHGINPKEFIQEQRMKLSLELLTNENMKVKDVAYYLGYIDPSNFTSQFKKYFGVPPSEAGSIEKN